MKPEKISYENQKEIYYFIIEKLKSFIKDVGTGITPVTFYVNDLSAGVYILEITDSNGQIISQQKLIKLDN